MRSSREKTLLIAVLGMIYPWPANAAWNLDSMTDSKTDSTASFDSRQVNRALLRMVDRWNAHDIEGCLEAYWKSEDLVVVFDGQHFNGWQELPAYYLRDFHTRDEMGVLTPSRVQIRMARPDLAFAVTCWTVSFPTSKQVIVGIDTTYLQRFADGWKVISLHTSTAGM